MSTSNVLADIAAVTTNNGTSADSGAISVGQDYVIERLQEVLAQVRATISPVWPLKDYVAINPYAGLSERRFLNARGFLRVFSECELLMPLPHYADQFERGRFTVTDIQAAVAELKAEVPEAVPLYSAGRIAELLQAGGAAEPPSSEPGQSPGG